MALKDLRTRRTSIVSTRKLTAAMKMISGAKFTRSQNEWAQAKKTFLKLQEWVGRLLYCRQEEAERRKLSSLPELLREPTEVLPMLLVVFTSDRGLCGSFNQGLVAATVAVMKEQAKLGRAVRIVCVGRKGGLALKKLFAREVIHIMTDFRPDILAPLSSLILSQFVNGEISACALLYSQFHNVLQRKPLMTQLLPADVPVMPRGDAVQGGLLQAFPNIESVLESALEMMVRAQLAYIAREHVVSEHSARMMAMDAATENADDLIREIDLLYNNMRQEMITRELSEIVSGAEAI